MLLLLQTQTAEIPVVLGPTGTAIVGLIIFAQAALNFLAWRKSNEASHLRGAVAAMKEELDVYRKKTDRLEGEMKELSAREADCQRRLDRLARLYLDARGQEEDGNK
jgi:hypothetical protein